MRLCKVGKTFNFPLHCFLGQCKFSTKACNWDSVMINLLSFDLSVSGNLHNSSRSCGGGVTATCVGVCDAAPDVLGCGSIVAVIGVDVARGEV